MSSGCPHTQWAREVSWSRLRAVTVVTTLTWSAGLSSLTRRMALTVCSNRPGRRRSSSWFSPSPSRGTTRELSPAASSRSTRSLVRGRVLVAREVSSPALAHASRMSRIPG